MHKILSLKIELFGRSYVFLQSTCAINIYIGTRKYVRYIYIVHMHMYDIYIYIHTHTHTHTYIVHIHV